MNAGGLPVDRQVLSVLRVLVGAVLGGFLFELLRVPAGLLLGAIVGSALANLSWPRGRISGLPRSLRVVGFVLIGCVSGVRLEPDAVRSLATLALPVVGSFLLLMLVSMGFVVLLMRRYRVDAVSAVMATVPGGLSEIVGLAADRGVRISLVLSIHSVRLLVIVLIVLPAVIAYTTL